MAKVTFFLVFWATRKTLRRGIRIVPPSQFGSFYENCFYHNFKTNKVYKSVHFKKGDFTRNLFKSSEFWPNIWEIAQKSVFWPIFFFQNRNYYFWRKSPKIAKPSKYMYLGNVLSRLWVMLYFCKISAFFVKKWNFVEEVIFKGFFW